MNSIYIQATQLSPKVVLDKANNQFQIIGKSIIENAHQFYAPILAWFEQYFEDPNDKTEIIFHFEYINSSSYLQVANLTKIFSENIPDYQINIKWLYDERDDSIEEIGKDLQFTYYMKFNFIELNENNAKDYIFN